MSFLDNLTLGDLFIAITGIMVVSLLRMYYDSYMEKKKIRRFVNSLGMYNSLVEGAKEGVLIVSEKGDVIFANQEALAILQVDVANLDNNYLTHIFIESEPDEKQEPLWEVIQREHSMAIATLLKSETKLPVSLGIDKVSIDSSYAYDYCYIVVFRDMGEIHQLQEGARALLT